MTVGNLACKKNESVNDNNVKASLNQASQENRYHVGFGKISDFAIIARQNISDKKYCLSVYVYFQFSTVKKCSVCQLVSFAVS